MVFLSQLTFVFDEGYDTNFSLLTKKWCCICCHHLYLYSACNGRSPAGQRRLISYLGDQKLRQIRQSLASTKSFWAIALQTVKNCCFTETEHKLYRQWQITLPFQSKTVCFEHSDWSKYIFVTNEYTANVICCSPQLLYPPSQRGGYIAITLSVRSHFRNRYLSFYWKE